MSAASEIGLKFSSKNSSFETASMMSDVGLSIFQLRIHPRIWYNLRAKKYEPGSKMKDLMEK